MPRTVARYMLVLIVAFFCALLMSIVLVQGVSQLPPLIYPDMRDDQHTLTLFDARRNFYHPLIWSNNVLQEPIISADGTTLVYIERIIETDIERLNIQAISTKSDNPVTLNQHERLSIDLLSLSENGDYLAYATSNGIDNRAYIIWINDAEVLVRTERLATIVDLVWVDATRLQLATLDENLLKLYEVSPESGMTTILQMTLSIDLSTTSDVRISPDGRTVAIDAGDLHLLDIETRSVNNLTQLDSGRIRSPMWSPDSTQIAVLLADGAKYGIGLVDRDTGAVTILVEPGNTRLVRPAWSPDGQWLIYGERQGTTYAACIVSVNDDSVYCAGEWLPDMTWWIN